MNNQGDLYSKLDKYSNLDTIQNYIREVIDIRGFKNQPIEQTVLLLIEEVGELAKAIRKEKTNMRIDRDKIANYDTVENEIADVFIVLTSICNTLNINLFESILAKERINISRKWSE